MSGVAIACTVAGSDPSGGAGIQADLRTFALHGVHGAAVLTALTAQDTTGVRAAWAMTPEQVARQLDTVLDDLRVGALKTGMLANVEIATAVGDALRRRALPAVVVDPVLVATSGDPLFTPGDAARWLDLLGDGLATLWTPNLDEVALLLGARPGEDRGSREAAARALSARVGAAVLLKGGHAGADADDCLWHDGRATWLAQSRLPLAATHGTGCHLSAAIAARLARGETLPDAVAGAKVWLTAALAAAFPVGRGAVPPWPAPDRNG